MKVVRLQKKLEKALNTVLKAISEVQGFEAIQGKGIKLKSLISELNNAENENV